METKLENLKQAPFNTTLMGVVRGVVDFYGIELSDEMLFGGGGHGFVLNIHKEICPSGPYVWNKGPIRSLLRNLGVQMDYLGEFTAANSLEDRSRVEAILRAHLDEGQPCSLLSMENQLITGYDDGGFQVTQPWPVLDFPPKTLSFGSWGELGNEIHLDFYLFRQCDPAPMGTLVEDGLRYAVRAWRDPKSQTADPYGFGPDAYENWRTAIAAGFGDSHGNWWNGTVWAECRRHLPGFFREVAPQLTRPELGEDLAAIYSTVAGLLLEVSDKAKDASEKIPILVQAQAAEEEAVCQIEDYLATQ